MRKAAAKKCLLVIWQWAAKYRLSAKMLCEMKRYISKITAAKKAGV